MGNGEWTRNGEQGLANGEWRTEEGGGEERGAEEEGDEDNQRVTPGCLSADNEISLIGYRP